MSENQTEDEFKFESRNNNNRYLPPVDLNNGDDFPTFKAKDNQADIF